MKFKNILILAIGFFLMAFVMFILLFGMLQAQYTGPCTDGANTSGDITVTSLLLEDGSKVVKIYDTDLDSLEVDTSKCFDAARWLNAVFGDSLDVYNQKIGANVNYKIRVDGTIGSDSAKVWLVGKMYDENAWTVIDTFATNKSTWYIGSFSIINAVTLAAAYPLWGIKLTGEGAAGIGITNGAITIYIWCKYSRGTGGGDKGTGSPIDAIATPREFGE